MPSNLAQCKVLVAKAVAAGAKVRVSDIPPQLYSPQIDLGSPRLHH